MSSHMPPSSAFAPESHPDNTMTVGAPQITAMGPAVASVALVDAPPQPMTPQQRPEAGISVGVLVLLSVGVTAAVAVGDILINGSLTMITGAMFVVVSVLAAALVRYRDLSTAVITPPLAYLVAIVVSGQFPLFQGDTDRLLIREGIMVVTGLAINAPWIFAGTAAALLIVTVRRWILRR